MDYLHETKRNIRLRREKEIVGTDFETGGKGEFVVMDFISVMEPNFVLVIEVKGSSVGDAMKQCLAAMKDNNSEGVVYGFITTGEHWQMLRYDGKMFQMTEKFMVLFNTMQRKCQPHATNISLPSSLSPL